MWIYGGGMFIRILNSKGKSYLNIVHSYRKDGKIKQKYIASFGAVDSINRNHIIKLAYDLIRFCDQNPDLFHPSMFEEKDRKIFGPFLVFKKLWELFNIDSILSKIISARKIKYDFFNSVLLMIINRLSDPGSKLHCYKTQDKYLGLKKEEEVNHLYRSLDILADEKENIELELFEKQKNLFNMKIDLVLYDVTTLYFESNKVDDLRRFGFSKDCKINEVQILLGLLVDMNGSPIGFDIFPGNKFEGHTIKEQITKLKERFEINRIIIVGDRAMVSKENIEIIKSVGYEYIVGARIKNKNKELQEKIFANEDYRIVSTNEETEFKYKIIESEENKLISIYSAKRAAKDKSDRERLIEKAKKLVKGGEIISRRGALKYIDVTIEEKPKVLEDKIKEEERWDGYYGIETNCKELNSEKVIEFYHELWRVEESFRILKTHFEARPIFHWTPKRIKGHLVICFIAFLLERRLEIILKRKNIEYSVEKIRSALNELQVSIIEVEGSQFYLRSKVDGLGYKILKELRIPIPPKVILEPEKFMQST